MRTNGGHIGPPLVSTTDSKPVINQKGTHMIQARGLTKRYGSTVAVDNLSFDVLPGRVTGFLGPNGSGKSTTLRMVLGLDAPSAGSVTINGRPYGQHRRPLQEIGALLDAKAIHGGRSAYNHLLCLAQASGIPRSRVGEVLERVGMSSVAHKQAGNFSLGMGQRLGIAAALLGDPGVVLFDEPVNGLDPEGIVWIRMLMRSLAAEGRAVFVSSHLMSEMAITADHLIVIGQGRLIVETSMADFILSSSKNHVRVRTPQPRELIHLLSAHGGTTREEPGMDGALSVTGLDCPAIGDLAAAHQIGLHELSPQQPSLEDAFMEMTHDAVDYRAEVRSDFALTAVGA
jgi:ABC-2 type transport system ATP-binding protein